MNEINQKSKKLIFDSVNKILILTVEPQIVWITIEQICLTEPYPHPTIHLKSHSLKMPLWIKMTLSSCLKTPFSFTSIPPGLSTATGV